MDADVMTGRIVFTDGTSQPLYYNRMGRRVDCFEMDGARFEDVRKHERDIAELHENRRELESELEQSKMANELLRKSEAVKTGRIDELERLIGEMWHEITTCPDYRNPPCMTDGICERMKELRIEVER